MHHLVKECGALVIRETHVIRTQLIQLVVAAQPSQRQMQGEVLELGYVVEKVTSNPDPSYDFPLRLRFVRLDGDFKLQEGRLERNLGAVLDPSVMANANGHACGATPNLLSRSINLDLSELDRSVLPTRGELVEILGAPGEMSSDGAVLTYRYRLRNSQRKEALAIAWFDPSGQELRRVQFRYQRYEMDADFVTLNAAIRLRL